LAAGDLHFRRGSGTAEVLSQVAQLDEMMIEHARTLVRTTKERPLTDCGCGVGLSSGVVFSPPSSTGTAGTTSKRIENCNLIARAGMLLAENKIFVIVGVC
jgi:hypothetical protein